MVGAAAQHQYVAIHSEEREIVGDVMLLPRRPRQVHWLRWAPATLALLMGAAALSFFARPGLLLSSRCWRCKSLIVADEVGLRGQISLVEDPSAGLNGNSPIASTSATSDGSLGDIRIRVCRDENCDKFHPHGLVHEYTSFLNRCDTVSEEGKAQTNGKYMVIGATAATLSEGMVLMADHCNGNKSAVVHHHPFTLTIGKFSDCCSFTNGGCGFKCITFAINEVPPAYSSEGMDVGYIQIKVCRNRDCDTHHPHGLVHKYTAELNRCARIPRDHTKKTNGKYEIVGATAASLADGTVLTAKQCGNETAPVKHGAFSLIVGQFTDCCSFRHGGCGFKCITFKQDYVESDTDSLTIAAKSQ